ncbi:DNA-binding response regulator, OmpR family, contains REC and winged-helix (wHTH) domain [Jiangella alkaliphila]|uniref:DNA-binding response regulator, OmpR family, contains REC and winged-helix (WHTH) domain n=1 Tax=Jiangella alkaliphila TaxID=419479 RepID=A0A1H2L6J7_9ACTN|nr:DNA-binding response regulator, OmpR family, contains REC and winged-helix (wHTH) domain [Jiangella alkaliphila]
MLEEDYGLRTSLRLVLEQDGYTVVEAADAMTALALVRAEHVDVMLVDLMLGGLDGFTFIRSARPDATAPIIVISARDAARDVVTALEAGADDYIRKPFDVAEVQARLRAALRRPAIAAHEAPDAGSAVVLDSRYGPLVFDPVAATLRRGEEEVHLTYTEFKLLHTLTENAGKVMARGSLLSQVWTDGHFGDERIVDVHIRRLRTKIEQDPGAPALVLTIRGLGYRLDPQ